jgi:hypothetical protein
MIDTQKPKKIGVVFMLLVLLVVFWTGQILWSFSSSNYLEYIQQHNPVPDTHFEDSLSEASKTNIYALTAFVIYAPILVVFFGLILIYRSKPEYFITRLCSIHRKKVLAIIIITTVVFFCASVWPYIIPLRAQNSAMLDSLHNLRQNSQ